MSNTELHPSRHVSAQVATDYITQKHDCTSLDEFDPDECVPCTGCGHAECRHEIDAGPFPAGAEGLSAEQLAAWRYAQARWVTAALSSSPCGVDGCGCSRMRGGDECQDCDGHGYTEDERTGLIYTCRACGGNQVIA